MLHCVTLMDEWMEILWDKPISCDRFLTAKVERVLMGSFLSCSVFSATLAGQNGTVEPSHIL